MPSLPHVPLARSPLSTMLERHELRTNDSTPTPILRRAPVLLDSHWETLAFLENVPPRQLGAWDNNTHDSNLRRSISHRISRVATTTLGRNLSESFRKPRSASQSRVPGGAVRYHSQVRIRKVHSEDDSTRPFFASDGCVSFEKTIGFPSTNDAHSRARDLAMSSLAEIPVPALLQQGVAMTKVSAKSQKSYLFKLDADQGQIIWESKRWRISMCFWSGNFGSNIHSLACHPR